MPNQKNYKSSKKTMAFYQLYFNFYPPFTVIIDGNFMHEAIRRSYDIQKLLSKHLKAKFRILTTKCVLHELELIGKTVGETLGKLRTFKKSHCLHDLYLEPSLCIEKQVGSINKNRLIVATQDEKLIEQLNNIPGVPIFHMKNEILILMDPSEASNTFAKKEDKKKLMLTKEEKLLIQPFKEQQEEEKKKEFVQKLRVEREQSGIKLKKRAKGPNPLSMKKKLHSE